MPRRRALLAAAALLVPVLATLTGCGSGSGQLTVSITGAHTGPAGYDPAKPDTYPHYSPGDEANFTLHVVNHGPGGVTGVTVHVALPETFRYHASSLGAAPGATRTQPLDAAVNSTTPIFGLWTLGPPGSAGPGVDSSIDIGITVEIAGQPGAATVQAFAAGDTSVGQSNTAAYNVVVDAAAKISALVSANPSSVRRGGIVTYQVRVLNDGTGPASGVAVLVTLPPVMTFAGSVTPFAGNGTRNRGVDPIKNTLEVYYDGFTLPPLSNAGPGYVVIVFKAAVLGGGRVFTPATPVPENGPGQSPGSGPAPSSAPSTVPPGTYTVDANLSDFAGDTFSVHAVAPVAVT